MDKKFTEAYGSLNAQQRQAVDTLEGPVLVIAGPGTGKTQLVSTRVGHILKTSDTLPQNILLLTFTEAGVDAMRERLTKLLGQTAYEINISTYHAFGSEIIRRYPEYFETGLEPIDELESFTTLRTIISRLTYSNPMKYVDAQLPDILRFISDSKRALLQPEDVEKIAKQNIRQIIAINKEVAPILKQLGIVSKKTMPLFIGLLPILKKHTGIPANLPNGVLPLADYAYPSLQEALNEFHRTSKTTAVTVWKNNWLAKDREGKFVFSHEAQNQKLASAANVYKKYQTALAAKRLYDYDDMILRAIDVLQRNSELKYSIAEQYLYIMLDEFQDTNPAQMRLIELLTDHPVLEARPNVLAVGDDDQAIYAFQGADHANMAGFTRRYKNVKIISLKQNYRSQPEILETASNIVVQISDRLHEHIAGIEKKIVAASEKSPKKVHQAREFKSDAAQYEWITQQIKKLNQKAHIPLSEIAVLAPRHRNLVPLLPYLSQFNLPVRYERRDNILDAPLVRQLEQMSRLTLTLVKNQLELADNFWPEVISYDFWGLKTEDIWQISWQADHTDKSWTQSLLKNPQTKKIVLFFLRLKDILSITTLEQQLDILVGIPEVSAQFKMPLTSPFFKRYFGIKAQEGGPSFVELLGQLSTLRRHLNDRRAVEERPLGLADFILFVDEYKAAGLNVLDTNAYREAEEAVNIMTAYGAKGREFRVVFLVDAQDEVWGAASRTRGQYLSLPANLQFIRYRGASEDERLRLLYVAITRAKTHLFLTSYSHTLAGKATTRLKYLDIRQDEDGKLRTYVLPRQYNLIHTDDKEVISLEAAQNYWSARHQPPFKPSLHKLLADHLKHYQLSATHVNQFIDVSSGGPQNYLLYYLLQFPRAKTPASRYGTAIHDTIRWFYQTAISEKTRAPGLSKVLFQFEDRLTRQKLPPLDHQLFLERGVDSLTAWLSEKGDNYSPTDKYEFNFKNEASFVGDVHLTGKVDRLSIDRKKRIITVTDFKTGQPYRRWASNNIRLHKYRQQLLIYKLLIENSRNFKGYKVEKGVIEFIEPDEYGQIVQLELVYDQNDLEQMQRMLASIWWSIQKLELPDLSKYTPAIAGIRQFEKDLSSQK